MTNIKTKIKLWESESLISSEQATKLIEFESTHTDRNWISYGAAGVGITAIATGFISIIAANWDSISSQQKLLLYFAIQAILGIGIFIYRLRTRLVREVLITLFGLFILGGIGLIGQIFHLESDGWQGIRFWLIAALPVTLLARSRLLPHLWFVGLTSAVIIWITSLPYYAYDLVEVEGFSRVGIAIAIAYVVLGIGLSRFSMVSQYFIDAARSWGFLYILFPITFLINSIWAYSSSSSPYVSINYLFYPWLGGAFALACLLFCRTELGRRANTLRILVSAFVIVPLLGLTIPALTQIYDQPLIGCAISLIVWTIAAGIAAHLGNKRLFNLATLTIALRLVTVYFELFGTLAATGGGLIATGVVILGIVLAWNKIRKIAFSRFGSAV